MWDKIKSFFSRKDQAEVNPVVQLQVFQNGSWKDIKNKNEVEEGKNKKFRHVITLQDGRVEIVDGV